MRSNPRTVNGLCATACRTSLIRLPDAFISPCNWTVWRSNSNESFNNVRSNRRKATRSSFLARARAPCPQRARRESAHWRRPSFFHWWSTGNRALAGSEHAWTNRQLLRNHIRRAADRGADIGPLDETGEKPPISLVAKAKTIASEKNDPQYGDPGVLRDRLVAAPSKCGWTNNIVAVGMSFCGTLARNRANPPAPGKFFS
jgi:hypothetical protein